MNVVQRKKSDIHISSTPNKNRDENPDPHTKYQLPNELGYVPFYVSTNKRNLFLGGAVGSAPKN